MDSLDAIPSADYASLLTLSSPNEANEAQQSSLVDDKENFTKSEQEHIYAQVIPNRPCQEPKPAYHQSKDKTKNHLKLDANSNKILLHNTYVLRNPTLTLSHSNSVPDIRKSSSANIPSLCPNNYGSLNVTKVDSKALVKKTDSATDSSVFSISGRRVIVSSGFKGNGNKKKNNSAKRSSGLNQSSEGSNHWSRSSSTDSHMEAKRRKLQVCTDCFSLCLFVPGTMLCILSPWLLVPIYVIPNFSGSHFQTLIWITCISSAILVFMGCMIGNVVWYRKGQDWKCLLHCGRGPKNHYWGDSLTSTLHTV